jgi:hypothetical protein
MMKIKMDRPVGGAARCTGLGPVMHGSKRSQTAKHLRRSKERQVMVRTGTPRGRVVAWARILAHWRSGASTHARPERATCRNWLVVW